MEAANLIFENAKITDVCGVLQKWRLVSHTLAYQRALYQHHFFWGGGQAGKSKSTEGSYPSSALPGAAHAFMRRHEWVCRAHRIACSGSGDGMTEYPLRRDAGLPTHPIGLLVTRSPVQSQSSPAAALTTNVSDFGPDLPLLFKLH